MLRSLLVAALVWAACTTTGTAQDWAQKMFKKTRHDFGAVARSSKQEVVFEFENQYVEDVHIASVRSSCGCTTPRIDKRTLKTWEVGKIVAKFNTHSYLGQRQATLTVVIDRPYFAEVQLLVSGYVRRDVVFDPGAVSFGEIQSEKGGAVDVRVSYAGRKDWTIRDIRSANRYLQVELSKPRRKNGRVDYDMRVRFRPGAPEGFFQDQLTLVTDDRRNQRIVLPVEGKVVQGLSLYPKRVSFVVKPGESDTKRLVLRSKTPFRVLGVECEDGCFHFAAPERDAAKKVHVIPVTFKAGMEPQHQTAEVKIRTDYGAEVTVVCKLTAKVAE